MYCMTRVTFDDTPSPFLFIATVQKHVQEQEKDYPIATKEVKENMYVDREARLKVDLCSHL